MTWVVNELLNQHSIAPKGILAFLLSQAIALFGFLVVPGDTHALATTTGDGLEHDGIAYFPRDLHGVLGAVDDVGIARHGADAGGA